MHHDGECIEIDELCEENFFYSVELKACAQVDCPDFYYPGRTGMTCVQSQCGRRARLQTDGFTCLCLNGALMTPAGNCVYIPTWGVSIKNCNAEYVG